LLKDKGKILKNVLMVVGALAICIVAAIISITPQTYDITQGGIAPETITAPEDFVDELATRRLEEEAQAMVGPSYKINTELSQQIIQKMSDDFDSLEEARAYVENAYKAQQAAIQEQVNESITNAESANAQAAAQPSGSAAPAASPVPVPTPYEIPAFDASSADIQALLTEEQMQEVTALLPEYLDNEDVLNVIEMTQGDITSLKNDVMQKVQQILHDGIQADDEEAVKRSIVSETARQLRLSLGDETLVGKIVSNNVSANLEFDEEATQKEREEAAAMVVPKEYKSGENIVEKGKRVTAEQYELLKEMGMLSSENTSMRPYYAVSLYIVLMFALYIAFLAIFNPRLLSDTKKVAILSILTALSYIITAVAQLIAMHIYPIILFVILGAVLLSPKNALVYGVFLSLLLASVTTNGQELISRESFMILLTTLTGSFFAVYTLKDMKLRARLILAGVVSAVPGAVIEVICMLMRVINMQQMVFSVGIIAASGLLCGIASIGVLPIIENLFKLTTPTKLLELSAPSHPLLQRLMVEAPGTYHHSVIVANLAEAASNAVGGYALMARVGAYFHDIGKLNNPMFFKENQRNNFNPHDNFSPRESSAIVKKHTEDGVAMMKKYKMPPELLTITREHHGNSLTGYFYAQALKSGEEVDEREFRYDAVPPTTKEGAIIMLADVVEAAVRSLDNPDREEIEETVNRLIKERYDDGQLDNAPLNRADLNKIAEAFINIFSGVYHQRIKYPEIAIHGVQNNEDNVL